MLVLQATGDIRKVSLWLGHANIRTTEIYLRADSTEKLDAIESVLPLTLRRGQFRSPFLPIKSGRMRKIRQACRHQRMPTMETVRFAREKNADKECYRNKLAIWLVLSPAFGVATTIIQLGYAPVVAL